MEGRIDTSFQTVQRDLFSSGLAASVGMNAFGVWLAIKSHADYSTGQAWPGMRRLATLTGLSLSTVHKAVQTLIESHLLRVAVSGSGKRGNLYVARERLDVRLGERVLCTIVVDYVPHTMRKRLNAIEQSLKTGEANPEALADVDILPGPGFAWDAKAGALKAKIPAHDIPSPAPDLTDEQLKAPIVQRVLALKGGSKRKPVDKKT